MVRGVDGSNGVARGEMDKRLGAPGLPLMCARGACWTDRCVCRACRAEALKALKGALAVRGVLDARHCIPQNPKKNAASPGALFFGVAIPAVHAMLETLPRAVEAAVVPKGAELLWF